METSGHISFSSVYTRTENTIETTGHISDSSVDTREGITEKTLGNISDSFFNNRAENTMETCGHISGSYVGTWAENTMETSGHISDSSVNSRVVNTMETYNLNRGSSGNKGLSTAGAGQGTEVQNELFILQHQLNPKVKISEASTVVIGGKTTVINQTIIHESPAERRPPEDSDDEEEHHQAQPTAQGHRKSLMEPTSKQIPTNKRKEHSDKNKDNLTTVHHRDAEIHTSTSRYDDRLTPTRRQVSERIVVDRTEQHNIIGQTKNWIAEEQRAVQFIATTAFKRAKEMIRRKRFVVIRGDSGTGKTRLAAELMAWLNSDTEKNAFNCKKPILLPNLQGWDKMIGSDLNLSILLDDIFGYRSSGASDDMTWWKQHAVMISAITVGEDETANFLIITIRNDIFKDNKSLFENLSLFDDENIINLSSPDYMIREERKNMLRSYTPTSVEFQPFSEKETSEIVDSTTIIGFPECCRLFKITPHLHEHRVRYFQNPLPSIIHVIKNKFNEGKRAALLYLLTRETVSAKFLDAKHYDFDKSGIEKAFQISSDVFGSSVKYANIVKMSRYLRQGIESLCDSFVRKENRIYRFSHDSIRDSVAILYGESSPSGFLKNCPSNCLRYIATRTCNDKLCKVIIDEENVGVVFQRILRELYSKTHDSFIYVASMPSWKDGGFLNDFFQWIKKQDNVPSDFFIQWKTDKMIYTDKERIFCDHEIVYDKCSFLHCVAKTGSLQLLKKLVNMMKMSKYYNLLKSVLDVALSEGEYLICQYLLSNKTEPDIISCFCAVKSGNVSSFKLLRGLLEKQTDDQNAHILLHACEDGKMHICEYLLCEFPSLLLRVRENYRLLHLCAIEGHVECFKSVVALTLHGKNKEQREHFMETLTDEYCSTVLHEASLYGNTKMCHYLINEFPTLLPLRSKDESHCLHDISWQGNVECFKHVAALSLHSKNKDERMRFMEELRDDFGRTVLHIASLNGKAEMCCYLINEFPTLLPLRDNDKNHCLHIIASEGEVECFQSVLALTLDGKNKEERGHFIETLTDENRNTVLHKASLNGNTEMCYYLINEFSTLLPLRTKSKSHCLHCISWQGNVECFKHVASLCLHGKNKDERRRFMEELRDYFGNTVLHLASLNEKTEMCCHLINEFPMLLPLRTIGKRHFLDYISWKGNVECFKQVAALSLHSKNKDERMRFMEELRDDLGNTVLHLASLNEKTEMCCYLINEFPMLLPLRTISKRHCLHDISWEGNVECFKQVAALSLHGKNTDERKRFMEELKDDFGCTILHKASMSGKTEMCCYLINEFPMLLPLRDSDNYHCLHIIASEGEVECFQSILALTLDGKNKKEREIFMETLTDKNGRTVLHIASLYGNIEMCTYLINEFPALLLLRTKDKGHCLHDLSCHGNVDYFKHVAALSLHGKNTDERKRFMEELRDISGDTVLHTASLNGKAEMCRYLINEFPTILPLRDNDNNHCLHIIASEGEVECFHSVLAVTLDVRNQEESERFLETLRNENGSTVLHTASLNGKTEICCYLINEFPTLLPLKDNDNNHCLHYIASEGEVKCFQSVLAVCLNGQNQEESERFLETLRNDNGSTVLHTASLNGKTEMCYYLINEFPTLLPLRDNDDKHCLHIIASEGDVKCFQSVLAVTLNGKNKKESERFMETLRNKNGSTVLHEASLNGKTEMCLYLIREFPTLNLLR